MNNIVNRVSAQIGGAAVEDRGAQSRNASADVRDQRERRSGLRRQVALSEKEAIKLERDLEKSKKRGWFKKAWNWLRKKDESGEIREKQARNDAGRERAEAKLQEVRVENQDAFKGVQDASEHFDDTVQIIQDMIRDTNRLAEETRV